MFKTLKQGIFASLSKQKTASAPPEPPMPWPLDEESYEAYLEARRKASKNAPPDPWPV